MKPPSTYARNRGTCPACKGPIYKGDPITKSGARWIHSSCYQQDGYPGAPDTVPADPNVPTQPGKPGEDGRIVQTIPLPRVLETWRMAAYADATKLPLAVPKNRERLAELASDWRKETAGRFYGSTADELREWLRHGYNVTDTLKGIDAVKPIIERRTLQYNDEEGEIDFGLALSGDTDFYIRYPEIERIPGLSVNIHCSFSANVEAADIAEYQTWIARKLYALESSGVDLTISYTLLSRNSDESHRTYQVDIPVKRSGEAETFTSWSALFSPGGFRHLGFTALVLAVDNEGYGIIPSLGYPEFDGWGVDYDDATRTLSFRNANNGRFPLDTMENSFIASVNDAIG